jgi:hypothetical protein
MTILPKKDHENRTPFKKGPSSLNGFDLVFRLQLRAIIAVADWQNEGGG